RCHQNSRAIRPRPALQNPRPPRHHASGFRGDLRSDGRPHLPRRTRPRSAFHHAPAHRLGPLSHTHSRPLPLRPRHPPRHRPDRRPGPQRLPPNRQIHSRQASLHRLTRFCASAPSLPAKSSAPCVAKPIHASKFVIPLALSDEGNPLALSASGVRDLLFALASCVPTLLVGTPLKLHPPTIRQASATRSSSRHQNSRRIRAPDLPSKIDLRGTGLPAAGRLQPVCLLWSAARPLLTSTASRRRLRMQGVCFPPL